MKVSFSNKKLPGNGEWALKLEDTALDQRSSAIPLVILNQDQFPFEDPEIERKIFPMFTTNIGTHYPV